MHSPGSLKKCGPFLVEHTKNYELHFGMVAILKQYIYMMYARLLFFVGWCLCACIPAVGQIATYQLSLNDSTQGLLYTYHPNKVAITNLPKGAKVIFGSEYVKPHDGNYTLSPQESGICKLFVYDKGDNLIFTKEFTATDATDCRVQFGNVRGKLTSVSDLLANPALVFYCGDCQLKPIFRIVRYTIMLIGDGISETDTVTGDNLTNVPIDRHLQHKIARMHNGDRIYIEGIKAYGPDERLRDLGAIAQFIAFNLTKEEPMDSAKGSWRPEISTVVDRIVNDNYITPKGHGLLERLQDKATDSELIRLTDYENGAVKGYAFEALTGRKHVDIFRVLLKHINDTTRIRVSSGCTSTTNGANMRFLALVYPGFGFSKATYKLSPAERSIIDSMLLFDSTLKLMDWEKELFLRGMMPEPQYYDRIRTIANNGKRPISTLLLAKFKNEQDSGLIKKLFEKGDDSYGVRSARIFNHKSFYPLLKRVFEKQLAQLEPEPDLFMDDDDWRLLCEALAQYPSQETYQLFEKITVLKNESGQSINRSLMIAIQKYSNPIFDPLKSKINLDPSHQVTKYDLRGDKW